MTTFMRSLLGVSSVDINGEKILIQDQIGEGGFAYIYKAKRPGKVDQPHVALKKMICQSSEQLEEANKEVDILSKILHPNVIKLLAHTRKENSKGSTEIWIVLPLYSKSLQNIIDSGPGFPNCCLDEVTVIKITNYIVQGLAAIHYKGYRHGDFKPANILLDENLNAVIADLGSASPLVTHVRGRSEALALQEAAAIYTTASFRAPELFDTPSQCVIDGKTDVWSFGCTVFSLLFSRTPFESPSEGGLSSLAVMAGTYRLPAPGTLSRSWPKAFELLISHCLRPSLQERWTMADLAQSCSALPNQLPSSVPRVGAGGGAAVAGEGGRGLRENPAMDEHADVHTSMPADLGENGNGGNCNGGNGNGGNGGNGNGGNGNGGNGGNGNGGNGNGGNGNGNGGNGGNGNGGNGNGGNGDEDEDEFGDFVTADVNASFGVDEQLPRGHGDQGDGEAGAPSHPSPTGADGKHVDIASPMDAVDVKVDEPALKSSGVGVSEYAIGTPVSNRPSSIELSSYESKQVASTSAPSPRPTKPSIVREGSVFVMRGRRVSFMTRVVRKQVWLCLLSNKSLVIRKSAEMSSKTHLEFSVSSQTRLDFASSSLSDQGQSLGEHVMVLSGLAPMQDHSAGAGGGAGGHSKSTSSRRLSFSLSAPIPTNQPHSLTPKALPKSGKRPSLGASESDDGMSDRDSFQEMPMPMSISGSTSIIEIGFSSAEDMQIWRELILKQTAL